MALINEFFEYVTQLGIKKEDLYCEKGDRCTVVAFGEEGEKSVLYNVGLVFFDDEDIVEVYIRKTIKDYDLFEVLKKTNELNAAYCGVAFLVDEDILTVKSCCHPGGKLELVWKEMLQNMQIAKTEFKNIG